MLENLTCHDEFHCQSVDSAGNILQKLIDEKDFSIKSCKETAAQCGNQIKRLDGEIVELFRKIDSCKAAIFKQESWMVAAKAAVERLEKERVVLAAIVVAAGSLKEKDHA